MKPQFEIGQKLLLAFEGKDAPSAEILRALRDYRPAGITLFRRLNVDSPAQVRALTGQLQAAAQAIGLPPLLIGTDQEGGQLMAIGQGTTPLPGNLALGAAGSAELARQAGVVLGGELRAMGVNVDYAPCCDVNVNPLNPVVGTRSFGEDPMRVAELASAMVDGLQSAGVAATAKHFPGHGDTAQDSHHGAPVVPHSLERLRRVELPPFEACIRAGVHLVMSAHIALPALTGRDDLPATLAQPVLTGLLRGELAFQGVSITDALDMAAIPQGEALGDSVVRAAQAGADLLLLTANPADHARAYAALAQAHLDGRLDAEPVTASIERIQALKRWLVGQPPSPDLSVVGCGEHLAVAEEIARRSLTLVRVEVDRLPLRLQPDQRVAVILPTPGDLTPADTSSYVTIGLADALRRYHPDVDAYTVSGDPTAAEIAGVRDRLRDYAVVIIGTINAGQQSGQAELVQAVLATGVPTVVAALRMPYDLMSFPQVQTYVCMYSILPPSIDALAQALFGRLDFPGKLPVSIPGI